MVETIYGHSSGGFLTLRAAKTGFAKECLGGCKWGKNVWAELDTEKKSDNLLA